MSIQHTFDLPAGPREGDNPFRKLANLVRRQPLVAFFVLAYVFSWWPAVLYAFTGSGPAILSCGPTLAALTVLSLTGGRRALRGLFRSMVTWRVGARWWAIAILGPVVMTSFATALNLALGARFPSSEDLGNWTNVLPTALIILMIPLIGGAWEEPGWRGYALPRYLESRSPLVASLLLGVLWSIWHVPVFLVGDQEWSDLVLVVVVTVALTWLFQNALGSVLVAMVFHAMNNAVSGEYFSQMFDGDDAVRQSWMLVVVWSVAAALVVLYGKGFRRATA